MDLTWAQYLVGKVANQSVKYYVHDIVGANLPFSMPGKPLECVELEKSLINMKGDIHIVTFPKTGTTLLQYVCHLIRMGGIHFDFEDIHQVCPHTSSAWFIDQDLNSLQPSFPRLFKSHRTLDQIASRGERVRFIATIRDPLTTLFSLHAFRKKRGQKQSSSILEFARSDIWSVANNPGSVRSVFDHINQFWACRDTVNFLLIPFEDFIATKTLWIPLIASFMGLQPLPKHAVEEIDRLTSRKAMMGNISKFDESWTARRRAELGREHHGIGVSSAAKVNTVESMENDRVDLDPAEYAALVEHNAMLWRTKVEAVTGVPDYDTMRRLVRQKYFRQ